MTVKFAGATVISFAANLGLGFQESTLNIELVQDCDGDSFYAEVGAPAQFQAGAFSFGGIVTNTSKKLGSSGKTISVKMSDPRQVLQNCVIVVDTYLGQQPTGPNFFNAYAFFESDTQSGDCSAFGTGMSGERGMPYFKILEALGSMGNILSPTGHNFTVDWSSLQSSGVGSLPEFYRVPGPSITVLDLVQNICELMGLEFYVNLNGSTISFGFIDLKQTPGPLNVGQYEGKATEISYGQELRNEVTKTLIFGEKVHYMSDSAKTEFFFGEDAYGQELVPVIAQPTGSPDGFVINKRIDSLNQSLDKPFGGNGPLTIFEMDIRAAMASFKTWSDRALSENTPGGLNAAVRTNWPEALTKRDGAVANVAANAGAAQDAARATVDLLQQPNKGSTKLSLPDIDRDLNKVWNFVRSLGETYYGKQYMVALKQRVCFYNINEVGEKVYSDTPTNEGGWVEGDASVLGLSEPELSFFRTDDNRVGCLALFVAGDSSFGEF
jgi:hypothetical protein